MLLIFCATLHAQRRLESPWNWREAPGAKVGRAWERNEIEGFAWPYSLRSGDTLNLYISSLPLSLAGRHEQRAEESSRYHIAIYRIGSEQSPIHQVSNVQGFFFPLHDSAGSEIAWGDTSRRPIEYKRGCLQYWQAGRMQLPTSGWPTGAYYAKLTHAMDMEENYWVGFIIRPANLPTGSKMLFKYELNTIQAYNSWGGGSLYSRSQDASLQPTDTIAMDRPVTLVQSQSQTYFVQNFLKVLTDSGYTLDFCTNIDIDRPDSGSGYDLLQHYPLLVLWNHDEYWSANERTNTINYLDSLSGHIARFAPNTCYWQIHWVDSTKGEYLKFYCRKDNGLDTIAVDLWRGLGEQFHEARFLGSEYQTGYNQASPPAIVRKAEHWIFDGTGLRNGDIFGIGYPSNGVPCGIVNGEVDNTLISQPAVPFDILADAYVWSYAEPAPMCILWQMVYYENPATGAKVFSEGAAGWICALDTQATFSDDYERTKTITINIIRNLTIPSVGRRGHGHDR